MFGVTSQPATARPPVPNPAWRVLRTSMLAALAVAILLVPVHLALGDLDLASLQPAHILGSLAALALLALLPSLMPAPLATTLVALALAAMLFVRLSFFGLVQFSGAGFTDEVFIHLEWESIVVAWEHYRMLCLALLVVLACVPVAAWAWVRRLPRLRRGVAFVLMLVALAGLSAARQGLPEWMLGVAARSWYEPKRLDLPEAELQRWRDSGMVVVDLPKKTAVRASAPPSPRNLILIYLESVGQRVIEHPDYPGLMPHLARRLHDNSLLRDYFAASVITIEGITNSQCGTLFPFERDSDSLAGFDGLAEEQPCLGDVLARAGYAQSYLGGADTGFAGKGRFLSLHGYDRVAGFEEWQAMGLESRPDGWGLGDPELFDQALIELSRLDAQGKPFNLTLLTIGTHLPGFTYEECRPYGSDDVFIEALHCADQLLEDFLVRIEADGYLENSVVVLTADHHVFPSPQMKRLFGVDAVEDLRLPLLVLGRQAPAAAVASGAGYDLAPTLLDLLGIQTDVRFALGRSLLRPDSDRHYYPARYFDLHHGELIQLDEADCDTSIPAPPLTACEKSSLLTLLRIQNAGYSLSTSTHLDCVVPDGIGIHIPAGQDEGINFSINGQDHAARFTWNASPGHENRQGLFVAGFSAEGQLLDRRFIPGENADELREPPAIENAAYYLLAWRSTQNTPPPWLASQSVPRAAALIDAHGQVHHLPFREAKNGIEFVLPPDACALWQDTSASSSALDLRLATSLPDAARLSMTSPFCPVLAWGPDVVFAGERFNPQSDGSSAFWIKVDCAPPNAMLAFDGRLIQAVHNPSSLSAALNADAYLMQEGQWLLELYDPQTRQRLPLGTLHVLPARVPNLLPPAPRQVWPAVPARIQPPALIARAGGALYGRSYFNSREALSHNYALGHRVFELDFSWTSDAALVLIPDWGTTWQDLFPQADHAAPPDHDTFLRAAMVDGQTPLDLARLRDWMREHPDAWIVADIHGEPLLGLQRIKAELADVQERIIPQTVHAHRYPEIRALGYEQVVLNLDDSGLDADSLLDFTRSAPLFAVTLDPDRRPDAAQVITALAQAGIPVYVHTFNQVEDLARFRKQGAHGLYTDFLHSGKNGRIARQ